MHASIVQDMTKMLANNEVIYTYGQLFKRHENSSILQSATASFSVYLSRLPSIKSIKLDLA
jgi:hypothetical protein